MFWVIGDAFMAILMLILIIMAFFMFDEVILKGYFATKLRKRFDVESLK